MFTIKAYDYSTSRTRILAADSFTIIHTKDAIEVTMHNSKDGDTRLDVVGSSDNRKLLASMESPPWYDKVIIENAAGKTTEVIYSPPVMIPPVTEAVAA